MYYVGIASPVSHPFKNLHKIEELIHESNHEKAITSMGKRFEAWCESRELVPVFPVHCRSLAAFLVDRCEQLQGSSKTLGGAVSMIKSYSGRFRHPWLDWQELIIIDKIIKHLQYHDKTSVHRVAALTLDILKRVLISPVVPAQIKVMMMHGHDGLHRSGELCSALEVKDFVWSHNKKRVTIELERSKVHRSGGSQFITIEDYGAISGTRLLRHHFDACGLWNSPRRLVFPAFRKGLVDWSRPMSTAQFRSHIKLAVQSIGLDPSLFAGHSLRSGGATDLFNANVPYPIIKEMGRWRSDAAMIYYRDEDAVSKAAMCGFAVLAKNRK